MPEKSKLPKLRPNVNKPENLLGTTSSRRMGIIRSNLPNWFVFIQLWSNRLLDLRKNWQKFAGKWSWQEPTIGSCDTRSCQTTETSCTVLRRAQQIITAHMQLEDWCSPSTLLFVLCLHREQTTLCGDGKSIWEPQNWAIWDIGNKYSSTTRKQILGFNTYFNIHLRYWFVSNCVQCDHQPTLEDQGIGAVSNSSVPVLSKLERILGENSGNFYGMLQLDSLDFPYLWW